MTIGKTIALTRWTFVGKVMSLLFNMLSRLVIDFLPRSKCLLISWLQSPSAVILEPPKIKSLTVSIVSHQRLKRHLDITIQLCEPLMRMLDYGNLYSNLSWIMMLVSLLCTLTTLTSTGSL